MNPERVRTWVEAVGLLAVILSVLLLVVELRDNTNAIQSQTIQALTSDLNEWRLTLAQEPELVDLFQKVDFEDGWHELTSKEQIRYRRWRGLCGRSMRACILRANGGVLGDDEWERFRLMICNKERQQRSMWSSLRDLSRDQLFTPAFLRFVRSECVRGVRPPKH